MPTANLLYVIEGGHAGGAEQNLLAVIKTIDKTQYKIKVCLLRPSDILEDELRRLGIPIFVLNMNGKWDIFSIFRLACFMHRERIDIVHTCLYASNTFGRIAAILAHVPIIITWEQGEIFTQPSRHYRVDRILAKFTDCIVACSKAAKEEIIKKEGIPAHKIRVIYNCVDFAKFTTSSDTQAIRRELGIKADEIVIGTIGVLTNKIKGQEYLIRAIPRIIKVYPKIKLLLAGEGPSRSDFIQLVRDLNIEDKVVLTGFRRDIPEIMNGLDMYVCSSIHEALGISIIEAMSFKKPVVATYAGGISEVVIEGQTGYLVAPKNADSIARAIITLLSDKEKMHQMGEAGFKRAKENFSVELIIKEIESLYKGLLWKIHPRPQ